MLGLPLHLAPALRGVPQCLWLTRVPRLLRGAQVLTGVLPGKLDMAVQTHPLQRGAGGRSAILGAWTCLAGAQLTIVERLGHLVGLGSGARSPRWPHWQELRDLGFLLQVLLCELTHQQARGHSGQSPSTLHRRWVSAWLPEAPPVQLGSRSVSTQGPVWLLLALLPPQLLPPTFSNANPSARHQPLRGLPAPPTAGEAWNRAGSGPRGIETRA